MVEPRFKIGDRVVWNGRSSMPGVAQPKKDHKVGDVGTVVEVSLESLYIKDEFRAFLVTVAFDGERPEKLRTIYFQGRFDFANPVEPMEPERIPSIAKYLRSL